MANKPPRTPLRRGARRAQELAQTHLEALREQIEETTALIREIRGCSLTDTLAQYARSLQQEGVGRANLNEVARVAGLMASLADRVVQDERTIRMLEQQMLVLVGVVSQLEYWLRVDYEGVTQVVTGDETDEEFMERFGRLEERVRQWDTQYAQALQEWKERGSLREQQMESLMRIIENMTGGDSRVVHADFSRSSARRGATTPTTHRGVGTDE